MITPTSFRFVRRLLLVCCLCLPLYSTGNALAEDAQSVTQYGITWTFDKAYPVGQFANGDYWVVGPVTITSVTPTPGPAPADESATSAKSRYGATSLVDDKRMRNGSMIILGPDGAKGETGFEHQGYDSRSPDYVPEMSVKFPCALPANQTLISTISSEAYGPDGKLATPNVLSEMKNKMDFKTLVLSLDTAAVLTCLAQAPPADAFRPPYVGTNKPIYETKDLNLDLLPKLNPVPSTPDWDAAIRVFQRPWLDLPYSWLNQCMLPGQNEPNYGREFARMTSIGALMLLLDGPQDKKQKLLIEYVQLGIDLHGITDLGRQYFSDGGHWQGRKWPILFASIMLNKPELSTFPPVNMDVPVYGHEMLSPSPDDPKPTTLFQEDLDTYYGTGGDGQTVLWQCVDHTGPRLPFQEKPSAQYDKTEQWLNGYGSLNSSSWIGTALAAQMMKGKALWNHDAFFDYMDYWMGPDNKYQSPKWAPPGCTRSMDPFMEDMWKAYRSNVPDQPGGKDNLKWVWDADTTHSSGHRVLNPKPQATK